VWGGGLGGGGGGGGASAGRVRQSESARKTEVQFGSEVRHYLMPVN